MKNLLMFQSRTLAPIYLIGPDEISRVRTVAQPVRKNTCIQLQNERLERLLKQSGLASVSWL
jgi:hypothetical protein